MQTTFFSRTKQWLLLLSTGTMLLLGSFGLAASFVEPPNLYIAKQQLIRYHDSGEYYRQIDAVAKEAMHYLQFRLNQNARLKKPARLAMVFDIDETLLSNYASMRKLDFGGDLEEIMVLEDRGKDPGISPTLALYQYALQHGVTIFLVTGRKEKERAITIRNLATVGCHDWKALFMKPNDYSGASAASYKVAQRKKIVKMGYDIVENIGDQYSDLRGGYADMTFKIPNPFYYIG